MLRPKDRAPGTAWMSVNKTRKAVKYLVKMVKVKAAIFVLGKVANSLIKTLRESIAMAERLLEACAKWIAEKVRANLSRIIFALIATLAVLLPVFIYIRSREYLQRCETLILMSAFFAIPIILSLYFLPGKRWEVLRRSLELLGCGLMDPLPTFMATFLICLGFLFAVEEAGGDAVRNLLKHVVLHIEERPVTRESIIVFAFAFLSSCIAAWLVPKRSRRYHYFAKLTAGVIIRILYILIVTALWLLSVGLGNPELSRLKALGFSVLLLWLHVWASLCLEEWRRSRRSGRKRAEKQRRGAE